MSPSEIIFGIVSPASGIESSPLAEKFKDLTLAWSRYQYRGLVVEGDDVEEVARAAIEAGGRYLFVQSAGCIVSENWSLSDPRGRSLLDALEEWVAGHDFLVAGRIMGDDEQWFGFDSRHLLIDLNHWRECVSSETSENAILTQPVVHRAGGRIVCLDPSARSTTAEPKLWGWRWIDDALRAGLAVWDISHEVGAKTLDLRPTQRAQATMMESMLGEGVDSYRPDSSARQLTEEQSRFLRTVSYHHHGSRRCVFPWNIEPYDDVSATLSEEGGPLRSLYSVAAGFKPNWILHRGGFVPTTRIVYFDYSRRGLEAKRMLVEEWDGRDFPSMLRRIFEKFPSHDTAYCLWDGLTPETITDEQLGVAWRRELDRWGGEDAFAGHWAAYRELPHTYIACDIVREPAPLFEHVAAEQKAVLWWSNAFFTVFANWHLLAADRRHRYERFIEGVASASPDLIVFGSDYNNANVNGLSAGAYWSRYQNESSSPLAPCRLHRVEIRM